MYKYVPVLNIHHVHVQFTNLFIFKGATCQLSELILLPEGDSKWSNSLVICLAVQDQVGVVAYKFARAVTVYEFSTSGQDIIQVISTIESALDVAVNSGNTGSVVAYSNALLSTLEQDNYNNTGNCLVINNNNSKSLVSLHVHVEDWNNGIRGS